MKSVAQTSRHTLAAQIRAYDLLQLLGERAEDALYGADFCGICVSEEACRAFSETFRRHSDRLEAAYDEAVLRNELNAVLRPLEDAVAEARFEAASAAALHEFAKEVFEIWQTSGIFANTARLRSALESFGRVARNSSAIRLTRSMVMNFPSMCAVWPVGET